MKTKNANLSNTVLIAALSMAAGLAGCAQDRVGERTGRQVDQAATTAAETMDDTRESLDEQTEKAGGYISDAALSVRIKAELLKDPHLALSDIRVSTTDGVVTLTGTVSSQIAVTRALEIVRRDPNVKSVKHNLVVRGPGRV
jgi:hyperosmotically inducible protein